MFTSDLKEKISRLEHKIDRLEWLATQICTHPQLYEDIDISEQHKKNGYIYKCNTCNTVVHKNNAEEYTYKYEGKVLRAKNKTI